MGFLRPPYATDTDINLPQLIQGNLRSVETKDSPANAWLRASPRVGVPELTEGPALSASRRACPEPVEGGLHFAARKNDPSARVLTVTSSAGVIRATDEHRLGYRDARRPETIAAPTTLGGAAGPF